MLEIWTQVLMTSQQAIYKTPNLWKFYCTPRSDPVWKYFKPPMRNIFMKWNSFTLTSHLQQSVDFIIMSHCSPFVKIKFTIIYIDQFINDFVLQIFSACICFKYTGGQILWELSSIRTWCWYHLVNQDWVYANSWFLSFQRIWKSYHSLSTYICRKLNKLSL